ncbi:SH3 domain-containing protein [Lysobacter capsici]|uniref:SH3 domain-containing protein n=1 Tax=Lysobacter capsici TaxID=435897 RepID=UPI001C008BD7|nr:SH3 domain-containing protein [Lysobacter capsici]QWF17949.1 hypothetical protein KME82_03990 [Lysobacter capsici]
MPRPDFIATRIALSVTVALLSAVAPARAQSAPAPVAQVACAFGAFVNETDPAGLNVRAGPGAAYRVLGTLPPINVSADDPPLRARVEVRVTAGADGWFRIAGAQDNEALLDAAARPMFKGTGWVSGRKLTVKSQAAVGRQRPDAQSPAVLIPKDGIGFDGDAFVDHGRLVACDGKWAQVEYAIDSELRGNVQIEPAATAGAEAGRVRAWVDRLCAVQETSCDGG